jgi:DNA-binding transcriptional MerR regulator
MTDHNHTNGAAPQRGSGDGGTAGRPPRGKSNALPSLPDRHRYSMDDLERETGINARTIRFYITQGLLQPAHGRGPSATYDLGHLLRLRMIKTMRDEHKPLAEIKNRLADMADRDIASLLDIQTRPAEDRWRRVQVHPDVELHIRERAGQAVNPEFERAVEALITFAETYLPEPEYRP